jgi:hypothetical protein
MAEVMILRNTDFEGIAIRYQFSDGSHSMDARVFNYCEKQVIDILYAVATSYDMKIKVETLPLEDGSLLSFLKIDSSTGKKVANILFTIFLSVVANLITDEIKNKPKDTAQIVFEQVMQDPVVQELLKEKTKEELRKEELELKKANDRLQTTLEENKLKKKKSEFYKALEGYDKVKEVSFYKVREGRDNPPFKTIERKNFEDFILDSDELEPSIIEGARIEIISPVLKKGKYKWNGIYDGTPIPFSMRSVEFKELVQSGQIVFKNGSAIVCVLVVKRKLDSEGNEKITGYEVSRVDSYELDGIATETLEGRRKRQKEKADKQQLSLFDDKVMQ